MQEKKKIPFDRQPGNHLPIVQRAAGGNDPRVEAIVNMPPSESDPQGSYTGNPLNENEVPVQDADDL